MRPPLSIFSKEQQEYRDPPSFILNFAQGSRLNCLDKRRWPAQNGA
ncbi:hypothetical protein [Thermostichus vulcanus]|uniref:Uncharacterized protein n=1 Tax=Thermostichus vulcanus str. 'Rupite' TaxID=2813851 RepID=A0ABT0C864_THEVL|nr:hypothetical protein [Thermostichus vulcanus]MCJ2541978.1 hypothetical protein [Thermostichus vulcanus str. 'Rupite']